MNDDFGASGPIRGFKLLTILGCLGTLAFLGLEAYRENFAGEWRDWQGTYARELSPELAAGFETGIRQAFLVGLGRVDRCQTCHVGIDDPAMAGADVPLQTHPADILRLHPPEEFGCTICHQGQGRAVEADAAHGEVPHWEEPLLRGDLVFTSCGKCHPEPALFGHTQEFFGETGGEVSILESDLAAGLPGAEILGRGKGLVATSGCLGCHTYRGVGGTLGPDLTFVGDKGVHGFDFSRLPRGVERTPLEWLKAHFQDPGAVSPGTVMPGIGSSEEDAEALAAYMLSLKLRDVPARYRVAPGNPDRTSHPVDGGALYGLFCVACHGPDLTGGDVPDIRTPSLSNEGFLSVAGDDFLTYIIEHGRSGTEMPAWGSRHGGLSGAQIAQIVGYVRSFEPSRADPSMISSSRGNADYGKALYRGSCAACHGMDGEGGIGTRLDSEDFLALVSDDFLARVILEGRPDTGMPAWGGFTSEEVSDLLAHIRGWQSGRTEPHQVLAYLEAEGGNARMGKRLYRSSCADCHGRKGEGGIGPSLNNEGFLSIVSDAYLASAVLEGRPGTAMPAWRSLSAEDVGDLLVHLRSFSEVTYEEPSELVAQGDPENGGLIFRRACESCHGTGAVGGTGPQLRNPVFLANASDGYLFRTIAEGRRGTPMRGFLGRGGIEELTSSQVADVVGWIRRLAHAGSSGSLPRPVLGSAVRGRDLYQDIAKCSGCHGDHGEGGVGPAIGTPTFLSQADEGFLVATLVLGREGTEMRDFASGGLVHLSPEQIMDVVAYVQALGADLPEGRGGWRKYHVTQDQIEAGGEHYRHYCASCHGDDGRGGFAPELNNPEFLRAASDGFLIATIARGRETTPMRPFGPGHAGLAALSHGDMRALVGFIRSWDTPGPETTRSSDLEEELEAANPTKD